MHGATRTVIAAIAVIMFVGGVAIIPTAPPAALELVLIGGAGILVVTLEHGRYRSEHAERSSAAAGPGGGETAGPLEPRFQRTDEAFVDPTSGRRMRVWLDPRTGERRYRAED